MADGPRYRVAMAATEGQRDWRRDVYGRAPERDALFATISGLPIEPLYGPEDVQVDYDRDLGNPGPVPVHARRLPVDAPRPAVDDAAVRGLRHARGDERALPLPARPRADGPLDGVRHADADGPRLRPPALAGRGRPRGRRRRHGRRHGAAVRRHPARRGLDVDDDQRAGGDDPGLLPRGRRAAGRALERRPRHDPDGHPQGVHRAEGVDLPAGALAAALRGHDRVLRPRGAEVAPGVDQRLPHPRGRLDGRAGAGLHARRRLHVRRGDDRPRRAGGRLRAAPELLLQRAHRLLRGDRQVPRRAPHLGARAARDATARRTRAPGSCASTRRPRACR